VPVYNGVYEGAAAPTGPDDGPDAAGVAAVDDALPFDVVADTGGVRHDDGVIGWCEEIVGAAVYDVGVVVGASA